MVYYTHDHLRQAVRNDHDLAVSRGTPVRGVRISEELWSAVDARAQITGTTVADIIRELLVGYVRRFDTTDLGSGDELPTLEAGT